MEVSENLAHYFKNKITLFHTLNIPKIGYINRDNGYESKKNEQLYSILDILGRESARAQNLNKPVTTRFDILNTNNRLYVLSEKDENKIILIGFIKVGEKKLYLYDTKNNLQMYNSICLLDFYIIEKYQRLGNGKMLLDHVIKQEKVLPLKLPIDRPSNKLIHFMKKHYFRNENYIIIPQSNNYLVYHQFFQ